MSAYVKHEVCYKRKHQDLLVKALEDLYGEGNVEVHEEPQALWGYQGDVRAQKAHIIVRGEGATKRGRGGKNVVGGASNDIGFEWNEDGSCTAHISEYDQNHTFPKHKRDKVASGYAEKVVTRAAKKGKWKTIERSETAGKVTLKLRRKNWG